MNYNTFLEILWNVLPITSLICIAIPSFSLLYYIDDNSYVEFIIKIMGNQWYWSYEYNLIEKIEVSPAIYSTTYEELAYLPIAVRVIEPQVVEDVNFLYSFDSRLIIEEDLVKESAGFRLLEVDQRLSLLNEVYISLLISASDVLHSWSVPSLGIKCDACPGRLNQVICFINRLGVYYGQCSEICGLFHAFMPIVVNVDSDIETLSH